MNVTVGAVSENGDAKADDILKRHGEAFDMIVEAIYNNTQQHLKKHGIENLVLYRGMTLSEGDSSRHDTEYKAALDHLENLTSLDPNAYDAWVTDHIIEGNPISSYSAHYGTASSFAGNYADGRYNMVMASEVDAKDIFATSVTGPGCLTENEVLVMRHKQNAKVLTIDSRNEGSRVPEEDDTGNPAGNATSETPYLGFWNYIRASKDIGAFDPKIAPKTVLSERIESLRKAGEWDEADKLSGIYYERFDEADASAARIADLRKSWKKHLGVA